MGLAQEEHGHPGLADAAAHGQGQLPCQKHLVEGQLPAVVTAGQGELPVQALRVHPNAHGGQLQSPAAHAVPHQQVAVQIPVVIVGGAAVVGLSGAQLAANPNQEGGGMLLHKGVLPLLGRFVGIEILQLLGGDKGDFRGQNRQNGQLGENGVEEALGLGQGPHNGPDRPPQIVQIPVLFGDNLLPVPLVHIGGVEAVQLLVPPDGVHIGIQALARVELIALEGQALPLGQGVNHHGGIPHAVNVKGDGALHPVQIVVQSGGLGHEQGGGHPVEPQRAGQLVFKQALEQADGLLGLVNRQQGGIPLRQLNFFHGKHSFLLHACDGAPEDRAQLMPLISAELYGKAAGTSPNAASSADILYRMCAGKATDSPCIFTQMSGLALFRPVCYHGLRRPDLFASGPVE